MRPHVLNSTGEFDTIESYSVEEILAAGGTTAFAIKKGKTSEALKKVLRDAPKAEPATKEELEDLMAQLARDK